LNKLQEESGPCEMIILVLNSGLFSSELSNELGTLARIPSVSKNPDILAALLNTYGQQVMTAYGFDLSPLKTKKEENSDNIEVPNIQTTQKTTHNEPKDNK